MQLDTQNKSIWILEDDPDAAFIYEEILESKYSLRFFDTLSRFDRSIREVDLSRPSSINPSLIIADLTLRDGNFLDYLCDLSPKFVKSVTFIIVSSCDELDVLRACFEEGALDYLTKPFTPTELLVKVERLLAGMRTQCIKEPFSQEFKPKGVEKIVFSPESLTVRNSQDVVAELTSKELQIFSILHRARGSLVDRRVIQEFVWKDTHVTSKTFDVHLFNLRRKLTKVGLEIQFCEPNSYALSGQGVSPNTQITQSTT